uniref:methylated diphthine methylhydrolase n=1 Tax=Setaria digitata TaxID=48799 RepID=A0A915PF81_9BILA
MHSCSLVLHEKPAAVEFIEKNSLQSVVATYELRDGNVAGSIYKLHRNKVDKLITLPGGIFRFVLHSDGHVIATLTTGSIAVVDTHLNGYRTLPVTEKGVLLSVSIYGNSALCTDVYGTIYGIDLETGSIFSSFLGHISPYTKEPCEVWTATWLDINCILSGGEDNLLKLWDLRSNKKQPVNVNRAHQSGVISLYGESPEYVISGSYDDYLRRIDLRNFVQCVCDKKMNGSGWSIRIADKNSYIVSCMYGGWTLIKKENFDIIQENDKLVARNGRATIVFRNILLRDTLWGFLELRPVSFSLFCLSLRIKLNWPISCYIWDSEAFILDDDIW